MSGRTFQGTLRRAKNGKTWVLVTPNGKELQIPRGAVASSLWPLEQKARDGMAVDFDLENGQPRRIRRPGEAWASPGTPADAPAPAGGTRSPAAAPRPAYHNPYNFIPAPSRDGGNEILGDLGDHRPPGHHRYHPDRWTGRIVVRMRTVTPLLLPDAQRARPLPGADTEHRLHPVRTVEGKPHVPPTSVKGMLRAAYEAVTNSRLGVFGKEHQAPLGYRAATETGLRLIPARIEEDGEGRLRVRLMPGTSEIGNDGGPQKGQPVYAAWLPRYRGGVSARALRYPDGTLPEHGDEVRAWIEEVQHHRWDRQTRRHKPDFKFWQVVAIARTGQTLNTPPALVPHKMDGQSYYQPLGRRIEARGYVCVTNQNINRKHDERLFFVTDRHPHSNLLCRPLTEELRQQWRDLILNYRDAHDEEKDIRGRNGGKAKPWDYLGHEPGKTAWSRHLYVKEAEELKDGDLCYAEVKADGGRIEVVGLYPVTISRRLFTKSPWDLLPESLRPAESLDELSPADRVFGWVRDGGDRAEPVAWRGCLRIGRVTCRSDDPVLEFPDDGLPLAILGQPKPQQFRFYAAADPSGAPMSPGTNKEAAYRDGQGLRGRKVYPHHAGLPPGYWDNPMEDPTKPLLNGWYREYRRPQKDGKEQRDTQNHSLGGWVKPDVQFDFEIHVENLSDVELGALLWLLSDEVPHHRLGGGKPLGFGSVRLTIEATDLRRGDALRETYLSLEPAPAPSEKEQAEVRRDLIQKYQEAVARAYGNGSPFEKVPFIAAFLRTTKGFNDHRPVHYPRTEGQRAPDPKGEGYRWFVSNEKRNGPKLPLPRLESDPGLPYLPDP